MLLHAGFSSCNEQGLLFVWASHFGSFSCWRAQALGVRTSIIEVSATQAQSLQCAALGCPGFTSCSTQGQSLQLVGYSIDSVVVCTGLVVLWIVRSPQTRDQTCLCLLHWQADSYLLCHQWSPPLLLYACVCVCVCVLSFSCLVVSNSLRPHGLQHSRLPCPSLMSTELVSPPNYLILCHPLRLLASIFPSIKVFSNELALWIRWQRFGPDWVTVCTQSLESESEGAQSCPTLQPHGL